MSSITLNDFADQLNRIIPTIMKEFSKRQENELYLGKISVPQFLVLVFLDKNGPSKMSDLAHFMEVTTPAMTGVVSRLVKGGYVRRTYDPKDRRIIIIKLTARGEKVIRNVNEQRRQMIVDIFGMVSEKDRSEYLRILRQIHDILTQQKQ